MLTNEKYLGNNVYNRTSNKLKSKRVRNPPQMWIRADGAFKGIVAADVFVQAQTLVVERSQRLDDAALLERLRHLLKRVGGLSGLLIDEQEDMPSSSVYRNRFGGLLRAYALIGFTPDRDYRYLEINRAMRRRLPAVVEEVMAGVCASGGQVRQEADTDLLLVNGEFTVSVVIARCFRTAANAYRWRLRFDTSLLPDVTVVVRMAADHAQVLDYYLFPRLDLPLQSPRLAEENELNLDAYRVDTLAPLYALAERVPLPMAA